MRTDPFTALMASKSADPANPHLFSNGHSRRHHGADVVAAEQHAPAARHDVAVRPPTERESEDERDRVVDRAPLAHRVRHPLGEVSPELAGGDKLHGKSGAARPESEQHWAPGAPPGQAQATCSPGVHAGEEPPPDA